MRNVLIAMVMMASGAAYGSPGEPKSDSGWMQRVRPGIPIWSSRIILDANSSTDVFRRNGTGTAPACVGDKATISIVAGGEMTCALTLTSSATLGSQTTVNAIVLTDGSVSGPGAAHTFPVAGSEWTAVVDVAKLRTLLGARTGVCSLPTPAMYGLPASYAPCSTTSECTTAEHLTGVSGTCSTSPNATIQSQSCAFVVCRAVSANTDATLHVEW